MSHPSEAVVRVIDSAAVCPELPIVVGAGSAREVLGRGNGGQYRSVRLISLDAGAETVELRHDADSVYYVAAGTGLVVDAATGDEQILSEGTMIHIDAGDRYRFAAPSASLTVLGGPCPGDALPSPAAS